LSSHSSPPNPKSTTTPPSNLRLPPPPTSFSIVPVGVFFLFSSLCSPSQFTRSAPAHDSRRRRMSLGMIEDCRERSSRRRSLDYRPGDETSGEIPLCGCGHERICGNPKSGFGFSDSPDLTARHEEAASSSRSRRSPSRFPFAIRNRSTTLPYRPSPVAIVVDGGGGSFPAPAGERNDRPVRSPFSLLWSRQSGFLFGIVFPGSVMVGKDSNFFPLPIFFR
ncbi:unnamed protein product, partial [Linum tenue]